MEDRMQVSKAAHRLNILQRREGSINGVKDVKSFDEKEIVLLTEQGLLTIKGDGLHVDRLTIEKGEIEISGRIDSLVYSEEGSLAKSGGSVLARLFG
ncbi:MAG: sporulation protein YabP [Lachnospiraceae bacterium]|nr:sporulation protein YabP [Lachnospiraceae bacterium]